MWARLKNQLGGLAKREDGGSIIELAIMFPVLLLLFVGAAELGRLFYTYNTLAKGCNVGARYLSASRNAVNGTSTQIADEKTKAKNLVVCGIASTSATACDGQTPIVTGLTTANVNICDNFAVACSPALPASTTKYFRVEITGYTFSTGVFNLASKTGQANSKFYFTLKPGVEQRYIPSS